MREQRKNRLLFLFGGGAAMDWRGPSTSKLTRIIRRSGFKNKNGKFVTDVIYGWLKKSSDLDKKELNFETIINVVEDIAEYWSRSTSGQINGLSFPLKKLKKDFWNDIMHFKVVDKAGTGYYSMEIPGAGIQIQMELRSVRRDVRPSPEAKYFEMLLIDLFTVIQAEIIGYSYITLTHSKLLARRKNKEINELAMRYFENESVHSILRLYTLNYDRIFQFIFHRIGLAVDQGFNHDEMFPKKRVHFNPVRVYEYAEKNCIYHLHGSIFWGVESVNRNGLSDYNFVHHPGPRLQINDQFARFEMERGKELFIGNIITGYRKSQRTSLSPFRQMFNAFDRDCYTARELIIVGYSFGDQHINDVINKAKGVNQNVRIGIVDPSIDVNEFLRDHGPKWKYIDQLIPREDISPNVIHIPFFNLTFYKVTFKEFLRIKVMGNTDEEH